MTRQQCAANDSILRKLRSRKLWWQKSEQGLAPEEHGSVDWTWVQVSLRGVGNVLCHGLPGAGTCV